MLSCAMGAAVACVSTTAYAAGGGFMSAAGGISKQSGVDKSGGLAVQYSAGYYFSDTFGLGLQGLVLNHVRLNSVQTR